MQTMEQRSMQETIKVEGGQLIDKVKELIRQGNVRRIAIKQGERTIVELPLTLGEIGAVLAPELAAVGAVAAQIAESTNEIERTATPPTELSAPAAPGAVTEADVVAEY